MTTSTDNARLAADSTTATVRHSLRRRYRAEKRFRWYGIFAIAVSLSFLAFLLTSIFIKAWPAFQETYVRMDVTLDPQKLGLSDEPDAAELGRANYSGVIKAALLERFPDVKKRKQKKLLYRTILSLIHI